MPSAFAEGRAVYNEDGTFRLFDVQVAADFTGHSPDSGDSALELTDAGRDALAELRASGWTAGD